MSRFDSPLNDIRIASPCSANWAEMFGNERIRFCAECKLNVYNLSSMSQREAEDLVANAEGRLCVRFYRRIDGTVITENCPVGWSRVKQRAKVYVTATFSLLMTLLSGLFIVSIFSRTNKTLELGELVVKPTATPTPKVMPLMGAVRYTLPTPTPRMELLMGTKLPPPPKRSNLSDTKGRVLTVNQN